MLRFLLLKVLPRRLLPILLLWEVFQMIRRLRAGRPLFGGDAYDDRVIDGRATRVPPRPLESQR